MSTICDDLRTAILQAAIQGKLTEQLESDGNVEELLAKIKNEKDKLIKKGVIKKNKDSYRNPEGDAPFSIPKNWRWCSPEEIGIVVVGATPSRNNSSFWEDGTIPWLPSGCCQDCEVTNGCSVIKYITNDAYDSCSTKKMPANTVMIALTGATAGKVGLLRFEACANQSVVGITPFRRSMAKYLFYQLMGRRGEILSDCVGSAQPHISKDYITKMVFPIPPEREQERIVRRVEDLLARVADLEQSADALTSLKKAFPDDIKASLLQAAMQGKLTKQLPEDGNAEYLLEEIKAEKEKLIAEGKIKKQKPLAPITDDEIPFSIPENWKWARWGDLSFSIEYGANLGAKEKGTAKLVRISDIQHNTVIWKNTPFCEASNSDIEKYQLSNNDILFARTGGTVGKSVIVSDMPKDEKYIYAGYLIRSNYSRLMSGQYLKMFMDSELYWDQLRSGTTKTAQPNCNGVTLSKMIIPIPPITEQERIVERLASLMQNINVVGELIASE